MALMPSMIVTAPEQVRRRYGLFDAASGPLDLPPHGEGGGLSYVPLACGESIAYGIQCYGTGEGQTPAPVKPIEPGDQAEVETGSFLVLSTLNCGAVGYTEAEYIAKARRKLESSEQATVENALWTGEDFQGNDLGILNLSEQAVDIGLGYDADSIAAVVGALEHYAYTVQSYGGVAYIHAPIEVAAFAADAMLIVQDGPRKVTPMGSVWVFGAYPSGSIIVTGQTAVWRSADIEVYGAFDPITNERLLIAERGYAVGFECFAGEAEFNPLGVS